MRLLLDTHIVVWMLLDDHRLSGRARDLIDDPLNTLVLSVVVLWEIAIKRSLGRSNDLFPLTPQETQDLFLAGGGEALAVRPTHTFAVEHLPVVHRDPFDRMLVAQALSEPLRLVTHDQQLAAYSDTVILV